MSLQPEFNLLEIIDQYRKALLKKPVGVNLTRAELAQQVNMSLPDVGEPPELAIQNLEMAVENGLVQSTNPRYFGFVIGGSTPVSVAADWLTSLWDQNAQVYNTSPAASILEDVVAKWLLELLRLPAEAGVGFVTGVQMANFTALTVARNVVLEKLGWNVAIDGLQGAPHLHVVVGEECHATILSAVHLMGLGSRNIIKIEADSEGRMNLARLKQRLETIEGPQIVCAQAGNVNTGAFDFFKEMAAITHARQGWLHIDGAFGLWARVSPHFDALTAGIELADSWTVDAHKWLNVPYDSGMVIIREAAAHQSLKTARCAYSGPAVSGIRDGSQWVPENSRRARSFVLYATLRNLGRNGVRELIESGCAAAQEFARRLAALPDVRVLNEVVLNQVLVRIEPKNVKDWETFNAAVAARIQQSGICWIGTSRWQGKTVLRISVSNYLTRQEDIEISFDHIAAAIQQELALASCR